MNIKRRDFLQLGCATALTGLAFGPVWARSPDVKVLTGPAFGSSWRLVLPDTMENPRSLIDGIVRDIDGHMSPFRADSDLGKFNAGRTNLVDDETRFVAQAALDLAKISGGAFDPTSAPIGRKYGFGPAAIAATAPAGMYSDVRVVGGRLEKSITELTLDLNGIAKGYALDKIAAALDGLDFLLELGGEVVARGRHPTGRPWRIGIERPGTNKIQRLINAGNAALATSGDAAQSYVVGGRRYAHVIDPRTAGPLVNDVSSVSVMAPSGMLADGLATAAMVLGPNESANLFNAYDARALFLLKNGNNFVEVTLGDFPLEGSR
ncbi:MAG: FAD:protein FMN transferase [Rhodospirillaceae bacterium]|jgi:FAD:protein FMN transferase|nr:FAD:protein FMN transferase [Rhodospirillaceae bacterium]MBT5243391.1 FAD:protein FMN transferase [Rhodospirillaceae bacterium]MBT5561296.1 FAD:protein FMN transferase [Rhodospirillaceae bacterium]MBT6243371.1 FAD:protein FMN transferase [Rhodospirillaceae bacterium]MBT7139009.1 FAD:protein FMN transferase [Rhodospirillaceae bacterium]